MSLGNVVRVDEEFVIHIPTIKYKGMNRKCDSSLFFFPSSSTSAAYSAYSSSKELLTALLFLLTTAMKPHLKITNLVSYKVLKKYLIKSTPL